jgi:uncharacterized protein
VFVVQVQMSVYRVGVDATGRYLVVLASEDEQRLLPIWIGPFEARAIGIELEGDQPIRPLTHDLFVSTVTALGHTVQRLTITRLADGIYYAELALTGESGVVVVDTRPSDGIAIAVRTGAPIWVDEAVLLQAQVPNSDYAEKEEQRLRDLLKGISVRDGLEGELGDDEGKKRLDDTED